jgi:DNA-binding CsgD family transcriptional regulator
LARHISVIRGRPFGQQVTRTKPLTAKQRRVIYLLLDGCVNKQIATLMGISEAGVKKHLETLHRHYGVATRAALIRSAIESGDIRLSLRRRLGRPAIGS